MRRMRAGEARPSSSPEVRDADGYRAAELNERVRARLAGWHGVSDRERRAAAAELCFCCWHASILAQRRRRRGGHVLCTHETEEKRSCFVVVLPFSADAEHSSASRVRRTAERTREKEGGKRGRGQFSH